MKREREICTELEIEIAEIMGAYASDLIELRSRIIRRNV